MTPSLRLQFWTLFCVSILSACPAFKGEHAFLALLQNGSGPWSDAGSTGGAGTLNDYEAFWGFRTARSIPRYSTQGAHASGTRTEPASSQPTSGIISS